jgi:hypothetical protein
VSEPRLLSPWLDVSTMEAMEWVGVSFYVR